MTADRRPVVDRVADLVFYGPLGLVLERHTIVRQLAKRGRRQVAFTKTIGRFTVRQGQHRLDGLVGGLVDVVSPGRAGPTGSELDAGPDPTATAAMVADNVATATRSDPPAPSPETLAIPQYDSLSAIQVVPRLEGLDASELRLIRDYEATTRSRRTILAKITQLQQ